MPKIQTFKLGQLDTLLITGDAYQAVTTLQGGQLLYFSTAQTDLRIEQLVDKPIEVLTSPDNWLWVSSKARFEQGLSVRGGIPICWPVFGLFEKNPPKVQAYFQNSPFDMSKHGFARTHVFELVSQNNSKSNDELTFQLLTTQHNLLLTVVFRFNSQSLHIETLTENIGDVTIHFSQALHSYLPTSDIRQTTIRGFDRVIYTDTTTSDEDDRWCHALQKGDIVFTAETDRIYHHAPIAYLNTPKYNMILTPTGSASTVIWNPWKKVAKELADTQSQFEADEYQHMLCIETANAHLNAINLSIGETHRLGVTMTKAS